MFNQEFKVKGMHSGNRPSLRWFTYRGDFHWNFIKGNISYNFYGIENGIIV